MRYADRLRAKIEDAFRELLIQHVEYCIEGCDPQDNLCTVGQKIVDARKEVERRLDEIL